MIKKKKDNHAAQLVELLGGTAAVASICGISKSAVSQWKSKNRIPKAQFNFLSVKFPKLLKKMNEGACSAGAEKEAEDAALD